MPALLKFLVVEDLASHEVETVGDDGSSHEVVTTLMRLVNGGQQVHHVLIILPFFSANLLDSSNNDLVNLFTCVSVDQNDPLVYLESPLSELNVYGFQHLDAANNVMDTSL